MNRVPYIVTVAALAVTCQARAIGSLAQVSIVDRDSGAVLDAQFYRGEYWVAGKPGGRYAIEIRNRLGERLMAVTSVDGVNVLSGASAGWDQEGYVFDSGQRYQITGWRKTDAEVAAFTFTDSPNSYAERTGRPANVGVIGVAVFKERPAPPAYVAPPRVSEVPSPSPSPPLPPAPSLDGLSSSSRSRIESQPLAGLAPQSPSATELAPRLQSAPLNKLGTGHGEREYSYVSHTQFARQQAQPDEVIRIRYDSLDNLVAMGVLRRPTPWIPSANPFPTSRDRQYVPDPPG